MGIAFRCAGLVVAIVLATAFALRAQEEADAGLQVQLGTRLFGEGRYIEALDAFARATSADDAALATRARKGKIRSALRIGEFGLARTEAEALRADPNVDADGLSLHGDALWAFGLFDEADAAYRQAAHTAPESARAMFGRARALASLSRLDDALDTALAASAAAPDDGEIHAFLGELYERMSRYEDAAQALRRYVDLIPNSERNMTAVSVRARVTFLESFRGLTPVEIDPDDRAVLHTVPFRLVNDKVIVLARVNGTRAQEFVLDTGSEDTIISGDTARRERVRAITSTISAGVGDVGVRTLQLARLQSLELGSLRIRNVPVLVKTPALSGMPRPEGESFSPLSVGLSATVDYQKRLLTLGVQLPEAEADYHLPMRVDRLPMVRGLLNGAHPAYFVVDTGGEGISISTDTARALGPSPYRRIPLRVWGTSGWDRDAFLMPGVNVDIDRIEYRNFSVPVLNLRAPSVLLGFQLGGILGHRFLAPYRVSMDLGRSEVRLTKF